MEGTHEVELKMYKPYGIDLVKVNPSKFEITLKTTVSEQLSENNIGE